MLQIKRITCICFEFRLVRLRLFSSLVIAVWLVPAIILFLIRGTQLKTLYIKMADKIAYILKSINIYNLQSELVVLQPIRGQITDISSMTAQNGQLVSGRSKRNVITMLIAQLTAA